MSIMHGPNDVSANEMQQNAVVEAGGDALLGKILRPKGTRDFPPNTRIIIHNATQQKGRYSYRDLGGPVQNFTIMPNITQHHVALVGAVVKNIGDVELDVRP